jgi:CheY-like chemotaxis protein
MNTRNENILVVDDDVNDVFLLRRAFQRANLAAALRVAQDGEQAVAYLGGQGEYADREQYPLPALILLDLKMPRKSGFEVLEWLRRQPGLRRLIVVVLSSSNQHSDINRAYDLGANSYLVKPAGFDRLLELVESVSAYWLILNEKPGVEK